MNYRFVVRGTTAAACAALMTVGGIAPALAAAPAQPLATSAFGHVALAPFVSARPFSPAIPSDQDIANAKKSAADTAAAAATIDALLAADNARLDGAMRESMGANDAHSNALEILNARVAEEQTLTAKANEANKIHSAAKNSLGQLAGNLYKTGGLNPTVQQLLSDAAADDTLYQATTLMALTNNRTQTFDTAAAAAATATALQAQALEAHKAADAAARNADESLGKARSATETQTSIVKENAAQRAILLEKLAILNNTTAALEGARVDALAEKTRQEALDKIIKESQNTPAPGQKPAEPAPGQPKPPTVKPTPPPVIPPPVETPKPQPPIEVPPPVVTPPVDPTPPPVVTPPPAVSYTEVMVNYAMSKIGGPYEWGGTGPVSFDCSGLVLRAFGAAGISVPRQGTDQFWAAPQRVPLSQMRYGDLLVFNDNGAGQFSHIAIYIGNNQVVQALNPGQPIQVTPLSWMSGMNLYPYAARY